MIDMRKIDPTQFKAALDGLERAGYDPARITELRKLYGQQTSAFGDQYLGVQNMNAPAPIKGLLTTGLNILDAPEQIANKIKALPQKLGTGLDGLGKVGAGMKGLLGML